MVSIKTIILLITIGIAVISLLTVITVKKQLEDRVNFLEYKLNQIDNEVSSISEETIELKSKVNRISKELEDLQNTTYKISDVLKNVTEELSAVIEELSISLQTVRNIYKSIYYSPEFYNLVLKIYNPFENYFDITKIYNNMIYYDEKDYIRGPQDIFYGTDCKGFATLIHLIAQKAVEMNAGLLVYSNSGYEIIYPTRSKVYCFLFNESTGHCINKIYYNSWKSLYGLLPLKFTFNKELETYVNNNGIILERKCENGKCSFYFGNTLFYNDIEGTEIGVMV